MILLVALDLRQPANSYAGLYEVLKSKDSWWHYLRTTWLVSTDDSPQGLVDEMKPFLRTGDHVLVTRLKRPYQGSLPAKAWAWIKKHIDEEAEGWDSE